MNSSDPTALVTVPESDPWLDIVKRRVDAMRFGSVQIVVHEGRVTLVEATEKTRLPSQPRESGHGGQSASVRSFT